MKYIITENQLDFIRESLINENKGKALVNILRKVFDTPPKGSPVDARPKSSQIPKSYPRNSREFLRKLVSNYPQLEQRFSRETIDKLADFLNFNLIDGRTVVRDQYGNKFLNSQSGGVIPISQLQLYLNNVADGSKNVVDSSDKLPRQLVGNPPVNFRETVVDIFRTDPKFKSSNKVNKIIPGVQSIIDSNTFKTGLNKSEALSLVQRYNKFLAYGDNASAKQMYPELMRKTSDSTKRAVNILNDKLRGLENTNFNSESVVLVAKGNFSGREVIEVILPNNKKVIMYRSTGSNTKISGKLEGEWFVIPGWNDISILNHPDDGIVIEEYWFIKTLETVKYSKGGNRYITQFAQFLEKNGSDALRK